MFFLPPKRWEENKINAMEVGMDFFDQGFAIFILGLGIWTVNKLAAQILMGPASR